MERSRMLLAVAAALFLGSFTLLMLDRQITADNAKLVTERDSLKSECSVKDIDLGRYEFIYNQLDTTCKTQIDSITQNVE